MSPASRESPLVIQTEHLSAMASKWLRSRCTVVEMSPDDPQFDKSLSRADGLLVRTYTIVDEAMLDRAPRLRVVGRAGTGLDNIDVASCRARGVEVVYTPDANTQAVVEFVMGLILDALRPRVALDRAVEQVEWNRLRAVHVGRRELCDLTLGILGLGRIGRRLAQTAQTLVATTLYNDLTEVPRDERSGAIPVSVEELFSSADVLSVHIDGRAQNRSFIGERLLLRMKPTAMLINTSRGFVVHNLSLANFLRANPEALALLDVHDPEPFPDDYVLAGMPNAVLYPHLASRTEPAMKNMSWVVRDVAAVLEGKAARYPAP